MSDDLGMRACDLMCPCVCVCVGELVQVCGTWGKTAQHLSAVS